MLQVLAEEFGAALVTLEHRYYGESSPFSELTTNNLKYLSTNQALFDLAVFRNFYQVCTDAGALRLVSFVFNVTLSTRIQICMVFLGLGEQEIQQDWGQPLVCVWDIVLRSSECLVSLEIPTLDSW